MEKKSHSSDNLTIDYFLDLENSAFKHLKIFNVKDKTKPWETLNNIADYMK